MEPITLGAIALSALILAYIPILGSLEGLTSFEANTTIEEILEKEGISHD